MIFDVKSNNQVVTQPYLSDACSSMHASWMSRFFLLFVITNIFNENLDVKN